MSRELHKTDRGHVVTVTQEIPILTIESFERLGEQKIVALIGAANLPELAAAHADLGAYLNENGYPALDAEPPAFDPEYVAEALRNTLRATSFEGGISEELVEDFIASYEKAVEDGARA